MPTPTVKELTAIVKKNATELKAMVAENKTLKATISKNESKANAEVQTLKDELSQRDVDERVNKIKTVNPKFEYNQDEMSLKYLDGVINGMNFDTKEHAIPNIGVTIPKPEIKKPKKGWIVENQTDLKEDGELI